MILDPDVYNKTSVQKGHERSAARGPWNRTVLKNAPGGYRIYTDCPCDPWDSPERPDDQGSVRCPHCNTKFKVTVIDADGTISGVLYRVLKLGS